MKRVFAYGALMGEKRGREGQAATLHGYEVRFTLKGVRPIEPSFAALHACEGGLAHGVLVEYSDDEWAERRRFELHYDEILVDVALGDGSEVEAIALLPQADRLIEERNPSSRYARLLRKGAEHHQLPDPVIERYRRLEREGTKLSLYTGPMLAITVRLAPVLGVKPAMAVVILGSIGLGLTAVWGLLRLLS